MNFLKNSFDHVCYLMNYFYLENFQPKIHSFQKMDSFTFSDYLNHMNNINYKSKIFFIGENHLNKNNFNEECDHLNIQYIYDNVDYILYEEISLVYNLLTFNYNTRNFAYFENYLNNTIMSNYERYFLTKKIDINNYKEYSDSFKEFVNVEKHEILTWLQIKNFDQYLNYFKNKKKFIFKIKNINCRDEFYYFLYHEFFIYSKNNNLKVKLFSLKLNKSDIIDDDYKNIFYNFIIFIDWLFPTDRYELSKNYLNLIFKFIKKKINNDIVGFSFYKQSEWIDEIDNFLLNSIIKKFESKLINSYNLKKYILNIKNLNILNKENLFKKIDYFKKILISLNPIFEINFIFNMFKNIDFFKNQKIVLIAGAAHIDRFFYYFTNLDYNILNIRINKKLFLHDFNLFLSNDYLMNNTYSNIDEKNEANGLENFCIAKINLKTGILENSNTMNIKYIHNENVNEKNQIYKNLNII